MTLDHIHQVIQQISKSKNDSERAHGLESLLWSEVLEAIAKDKLEDCSPQEAASLALKASRVKFARWMA